MARERDGLRIEVLYFDGCPHSEPTVDLVRRIAFKHGVSEGVESIEVRSAEEARRLRFLGSPTVRVNGVDVDPAARGRTDFAMSCRLYGSSGIPPAGLVVAAIRVAPECE